MLEPKSNSEGRAVVNQLMSAAENKRAEISIIMAGYKDEIENKLYAFNSGLKSRFRDIIFEDYTEAELCEIFLEMATQKQWTLRARVAEVAAQRVSRGRGVKGFANARSVRLLFEETYKRSLDRIAKRERAATRAKRAAAAEAGITPAGPPKPRPMPKGSLLSEDAAASVRGWLPPLHQACSFELLYRASRDGWSAADFHMRCDGRKRCLLVVRTEDKFLFGGYTDVPWPQVRFALTFCCAHTSRRDALVRFLHCAPLHRMSLACQSSVRRRAPL